LYVPAVYLGNKKFGKGKGQKQNRTGSPGGRNKSINSFRASKKRTGLLVQMAEKDVVGTMAEMRIQPKIGGHGRDVRLSIGAGGKGRDLMTKKGAGISEKHYDNSRGKNTTQDSGKEREWCGVLNEAKSVVRMRRKRRVRFNRQKGSVPRLLYNGPNRSNPEVTAPLENDGPQLTKWTSGSSKGRKTGTILRFHLAGRILGEGS